jgi:pimeloyl-ACP methyl ester carboxylesterase
MAAIERIPAAAPRAGSLSLLAVGAMGYSVKMDPGFQRDQFPVHTRDGWCLDLRCVSLPERLQPDLAPILLVPGYGMNSHVFAHGPRGSSIKTVWAAGGREVWSINMRRQGASRPVRRRAAGPSLYAYAGIDLPAAIAELLRRTKTHCPEVVLAGVSLGGTTVYTYLALHADAPVRAVVAISAPLRWRRIHPLIRTAFASRHLVGMVPIAGARRVARVALPTLGRWTPLLNPYVNARRIDGALVDDLVKTVEDPHPRVNRELAQWMRRRDLVVKGIHVAGQLKLWRQPLLVVIANRDEIVPECAALSVLDVWGGETEVLRVGDDRDWYAHADPYTAPDAHWRVHQPILRWLDEIEHRLPRDSRVSGKLPASAGDGVLPDAGLERR